MRSRFATSPDLPTIIICAAGNPSELAFFGILTATLSRQLPSAQVRCLAFDCPSHCPVEAWIRHWPGIELLQVADVVVGGGGYNTVYECAALGVPLVAFALPRRYDRQARRIERYGYLVEHIEGAIAAVQDVLSQQQQSKQHRSPQPSLKPSLAIQEGTNRRFFFENGIHCAIQILKS